MHWRRGGIFDQGFPRPETLVKLKNGNSVSLFTLIKSIPASNGMSRPQLFQQMEPNISGVVTIVAFQKQDHDLVFQQQKTLEHEIHHLLADGEEDNIFVDNEDGIWFGGVNKTETGKILAVKQVDKSSLEYNKHIARFMKSPPKKRSASPSNITKKTTILQAQSPNVFPKPNSQPNPAPWNINCDANLESQFANINVIESTMGSKSYLCLPNIIT